MASNANRKRNVTSEEVALPTAATPVSEAAAAPAAPQKVAMSKAELALYIRDGRPSGLLLSSLALMKGLDVADVARTSGLTPQVVAAAFAQESMANLQASTIKRIANVLGLNLQSLRLADWQVHVFDLSRLSSVKGATARHKAMRAVGLVMRGALVARLGVAGASWEKVFGGKQFYAAQADGVRAVFVASRGIRGSGPFSISSLPNAGWVCRTEAASLVPVRAEELTKNMRAHDLTALEFDQIFSGPEAFSWADIHVAARANGVTRAEIMEFIRERGAAINQQKGRGRAAGAPPQLRLVSSDA